MCFELRDIDGRWVPYVMDRPVGWSRSVVRYDTPPDWPEHLPFYRGRGFHVAMENGLVLSTQFGQGNYCHNRELFRMPGDPVFDFNEVCPDAELGTWWDRGAPVRAEPRSVWDRTNDGIHAGDLLEWPDGDTVLGYFSAACWWELVERLSRIPSGSSLLDHPAIVEMVTA